MKKIPEVIKPMDEKLQNIVLFEVELIGFQKACPTSYDSII
jgi:hypothetical protein